MRRALISRWPSNVPTPVNGRTRPNYAVFRNFSLHTTSSYTSTWHAARVWSHSRYAHWPTLCSRRLHVEIDPSTAVSSVPDPPPEISNTSSVSLSTRTLPRQCHGCGAFSQTSYPNKPGYFDLNRKNVKQYLGTYSRPPRSRKEEEVYQDALKQLNADQLAELGIEVRDEPSDLSPTDPALQGRPGLPPKKPLCDRCHLLIHNNTGESIFHPSMQAIHDTLLESPYKYNHVYHVLDAADFPMSLMGQISQMLSTMPLRSRNRRSRTGKFYGDKKTEMTFVINRIDLLAPTSAQVDSIFPILREILRDALDRTGTGIRLGNVVAVSAKRHWWVKQLREVVWDQGGGHWLVGKANVGKSQLFETIFPKGRMNWAPSQHQITIDMEAKTEPRASEDEYSLLPPAPEEIQYPEMPLVSDLPGTTASPIRIPFGNGRGELIDLPGLERSKLGDYVKKEHRSSLLMDSRIVPEQITVKRGGSLLLGGFIRITPREDFGAILTYSFTPLRSHSCKTDKAIRIQGQTGEFNVENIALPSAAEKTALAGSFQLKWDVTKQRTGPLTRKDAINLDVSRLPYRVLSTDILIEGVGWVEIVAQVRLKDLVGPKPKRRVFGVEAEIDDTTENTKEDGMENEITGEVEEGAQSDPGVSAMERLEAVSEGSKPLMMPTERQQDREELEGQDEKEAEYNWPIVDVYTPDGQFVSARRPLNSWMTNKPLFKKKAGRPRPSMKGAKKQAKKLARQQDEEKQWNPRIWWNSS